MTEKYLEDPYFLSLPQAERELLEMIVREKDASSRAATIKAALDEGAFAENQEDLREFLERQGK